MNLVLDIALTHVRSRARQSLVAVAGVMTGVGFSIMMAALMEGSQDDFITQLVDSLPHISVTDERREPPRQPADIAFAAAEIHGLTTLQLRPGIKNPLAIIAALEGWLGEHLAKIEIGDRESPRFKVAIYCHHVQTAKTLGRRLSKPIQKRVQQAFRLLVRRETGLFDGFVSKPRPILGKALRAKGLKPEFLQEVSRRNPTLFVAALLNARTERVASAKGFRVLVSRRSGC